MVSGFSRSKPCHVIEMGTALLCARQYILDGVFFHVPMYVGQNISTVSTYPPFFYLITGWG